MRKLIIIPLVLASTLATAGPRPEAKEFNVFQKWWHGGQNIELYRNRIEREQADWDVKHGIPTYYNPPTYNPSTYYSSPSYYGAPQQTHQQRQIMNHGAGGCTPNFSTGGCL